MLRRGCGQVLRLPGEPPSLLAARIHLLREASALLQRATALGCASDDSLGKDPSCSLEFVDPGSIDPWCSVEQKLRVCRVARSCLNVVMVVVERTRNIMLKDCDVAAIVRRTAVV